MRRSLPSFLVLLLLTVTSAAGAQLAELQPGARVRIQAPGIVAGRYTGTVLARTADTLSIGSPNTAPVRIPVDRITSAEVSRGSSRGLGALQGLKWGVPIGLAFGVLLAASSDNPDDLYCNGFDNCGTSDSHFRTEMIIGGLFSGAFWGAGIGALVGRERWERFNATPRTSFDVRHGAAHLGFAVAF
jgi:hypothetical protein